MTVAKYSSDSFTVNLSPTSSSVYSIGTATGATGPLYGSATSIFTSTGTNGTWTTAPMTVNQSGRIDLKGENADIIINGASLVDAITRIEERLNILSVNTALEKEWAELKALGDQYRALEKEIKDKMKTWDILKKE